MSTCHDCIHEVVCSALIEKGLPWADGEYPAEAFCMTFRNKDGERVAKKAKISIHGTTDWNTRCRCPVCNKDLFDGQKFCSECGQRIDWGKGKRT